MPFLLRCQDCGFHWRAEIDPQGWPGQTQGHHIQRALLQTTYCGDIRHCVHCRIMVNLGLKHYSRHKWVMAFRAIRAGFEHAALLLRELK